MPTLISRETAEHRRRVVQSAGNGESHWRSDYLGERAVAKDSPEAFLIEMSAGETLLPHFHEVDQFQVFIDGAGTLGRAPALPLMVHYADHHTAYGPIVASAAGLSYFTFRAKNDPGAIYLNRSDYRERLRPSRRRHSTSSCIHLATAPVLGARRDLAIEALMEDERYDDGVGAWVLRMGPGMRCAGPAQAPSGDRYYLVLNGRVALGAESAERWAIIFAASDEPPLEITAGDCGAEVLLLAFAKP